MAFCTLWQAFGLPVVPYGPIGTDLVVIRTHHQSCSRLASREFLHSVCKFFQLFQHIRPAEKIIVDIADRQ
jgi:hypothetical protein